MFTDSAMPSSLLMASQSMRTGAMRPIRLNTDADDFASFLCTNSYTYRALHLYNAIQSQLFTHGFANKTLTSTPGLTSRITTTHHELTRIITLVVSPNMSTEQSTLIGVARNWSCGSRHTKPEVWRAKHQCQRPRIEILFMRKG